MPVYAPIFGRVVTAALIPAMMFVVLAAATDAHAATEEDRPLGTLFGPNAGAATSTKGSVLPADWNRQPQNPVPAQSPEETAPGAEQDRPLGTLINVPPPPARAVDAPRKGRIENRKIRPARRVQPSPSDDASNDRPLGTLFGPQRPPPTASTGPEIPTAGPESPPREDDDETPAASSSQPSGQYAAPEQDTPSSPPPNDLPAALSADEMTFDRTLGLITANGRVEIRYGGRTLRAQKVTYNQKTDIVQAFGDVSLTSPSGEVAFGDHMEITGDLKDGVIYNIGLVLEDRSRVAGSGARRSAGRYTDVRNAVYSPCDLCDEDPNAPPIWQLKAVKVIHDADEQQVEYRDAWLELFGVPVAYTPYFSHPDPTVKRRSGFLAPSFSSSSDLGYRFDVPYFWAIDENQDATISPLITTDGGKGANAQYRYRLRKGRVDAKGSFVGDDPDKDWRGYIDLETEYHIDPTWRTGLNVERATDDTYTRRYGVGTEVILESRAYLEGFRGRNFQALNAYSFQDQRADSGDGPTPVILPIYDFEYSGKRDRLGGFSSFGFNALNLIQESDTDVRRLSFRPRWERPFSGPFGELYNASVSLAADAYHSSDVELDNGQSYTGFAGRAVPRASLSWRLPLVRPGNVVNQTIEPLASVTVAPNGGNPDKIPNEDSQAIEFDETNLFRNDLFDGRDRIDGGTRVNYGVNYILDSVEYGQSAFFLGQSYRPHIDSEFRQASGQDDNFSDFVGRVRIKPIRYLDLTYRTRFSPDNLSPQRNEVSSVIGGRALQLSTNYTFIAQQQGSEFAGREEIASNLKSDINRNWSTSFSVLHNISDSELRSLGLDLVYEDECLRFVTALRRSFFSDRDIKPSDSITFTLVLKTLGEVRSGVSQQQ